MTRAIRVVATVAVLLAGVACGGGVEGEEVEGEEEEQLEIGLVLTGPSTEGYYAQVFNGLTAAANEVGAKLALVENTGFEPQARIEAMKRLVEEGNELIVVDGVEVDAAAAAAELFPEVEFVLHAGITPKDLPNLHAYLPQQGVLTYIVGVLAGKLTKTGTVATLGGFEDIPTSQSAAGFQLGAQAANAKVKVATTIVGTYSDPAKAKQAATAQMANDADVLNVFLDAGFPGAVQAVEESGEDVKLFSATVERCTLSDQVVGSAFTGNDVILLQIVRDFQNKALPKGTELYGLEDPSVQRVALCPNYDTPEFREIIAETTERIMNGEIKLPKSVTG